MKRAIQAQIRCGGLSPEGQYFKAAKACGMTLAALVAVSCADAPKPVEPQEEVNQGIYEFHEAAPVTFEVLSDDGAVTGIGIRINGSFQYEFSMPSDDFRRMVIQKPDSWKQLPQNKTEGQ